MKPYAKDYALTDSVLQEARDNAKLELFGLADDNVCYARGVANQLHKLDHTVELVFGNRQEHQRKQLQLFCQKKWRDKKRQRKLWIRQNS